MRFTMDDAFKDVDTLTFHYRYSDFEIRSTTNDPFLWMKSEFD